ncbi:MAG: hypothetical protein ACRDK3_15505 [Actinomycetota bacterium]
MRNLSITAKTVLALVALAGLLAFALVADLGINAGVVHRGVTVQGFEVGGLTFEQTREALNAHRSTLRGSAVCFSGEGYRDCIWPEEVGWFPDADEIEATTEEAFDVGRSGGLSSIGDRVRAWTGNVSVKWTARPRRALVADLLDEWEEQLAARGLELDRRKMRGKVRRAVTMTPRKDVTFALEES